MRLWRSNLQTFTFEQRSVKNFNLINRRNKSILCCKIHFKCVTLHDTLF